MIIKEGKDPIARIVKRIAASYSYYFNKKYKRIGHVFQERFKSENIEDESYLMAAIRYIHQNPIKPGIGTVESYQWSSYQDYMGKGRKIADIDEILSIVSNSQGKAIKEFIRFNHEPTEQIFLDIGVDKEINGGNVSEYINMFLGEKGVVIEDLRMPQFKCVRDELIRLLLEKSDFSQRGIAITLGLNREMGRIVVSMNLSPLLL